MLWMFLIQLAFVVPLWITVFVQFINAATRKQRARATVFAILTFAPVFLIGSVLVSAYRAPQEDQSNDVFFSVFERQPLPQIHNLKGQKLPDEDELKPSPTFLSFQAPSTILVRLTKNRFTLLPENRRRSFVIQNWQSPPSWFSTKITPQTQVYCFGDPRDNISKWLFYEPETQTVRVFFDTSA